MDHEYHELEYHIARTDTCLFPHEVCFTHAVQAAMLGCSVTASISSGDMDASGIYGMHSCRYCERNIKILKQEDMK